MPVVSKRELRLARSHRFCMACGKPLEVKRSASALVPPQCATCGQELLSGPVPAVGVAVVESERVLLIRRRYEPMLGAWAIPGGFIEAREAPETTARREIHEETGLRVQLAGLLGAYRGGGRSGKVLFLCYRGVVLGGTLRPGDDASEAGFFSLWRPPVPLAAGPHPVVLEQLRTSLVPGAGKK